MQTIYKTDSEKMPPKNKFLMMSNEDLTKAGGFFPILLKIVFSKGKNLEIYIDTSDLKNLITVELKKDDEILFKENFKNKIEEGKNYKILIMNNSGNKCVNYIL